MPKKTTPSRPGRRDFLKGILAAGAAPLFIPASALGQRNGRPAPSNRITMASIGIGWQGGGNLNNLIGIDDVQYVAVCDLDKKHLAAAKRTVDKRYGNNDCDAYTDFREMIARGGIDAVAISLPDHWHALPAIECARAGMDIFGEKPFSHTLTEGRAMVDAVERYGRIWQTGSWQRSTGNFHRAVELVRNGRIGKVNRVLVGLSGGFSDYEKNGSRTAEEPVPPELDYDRWLGPAPWAPYAPPRVHKNWRWVLDHGGGKLMDWIGHHGDIAHWGLDLDHTGPEKITGTADYPGDGALWNAATSFNATCQYAGGLEMEVTSAGRMGTTWFGENGKSIFVTRGGLSASDPAILEEKIGAGETPIYKSGNHWRNFIECVKSRRPTITPAETAHRSASIGHLCHIAMRTGRTINWNPETETIANDPGATDLLGVSYREPWAL